MRSVVWFKPRGRPGKREWMQIKHENAADYEQELEIFAASIAFVRASKG
jgi:hypothetical protein